MTTHIRTLPLERVSHLRDAPIRRFLMNTLVVLMIVGFGLGGELALIRITSNLSLQSVWTITILVLLAAIVATSWTALHRKSRLISVLAFAGIAVAAIQVVVLQPKPSYAGYVLSGAAFLLAVALGLSGAATVSQLRYLYWSAVVVSFSGLFLIPAGIAGDHRILEMTTAFAAIVIVARLELIPASTAHKIIGVTGIATASMISYLDAARAAGLTLTLVGLAFLAFGRSTTPWLRFGLVGFQVAAVAITFGLLRTTERWFGGDQGVSFGSVPVNTNGRVDMWSAVLNRVHDAWMVTDLLGSGVGTSSNISMEVNNLPAPLSEFVRLYADFGIIGVLVIFAVLAWLVWNGLRLMIEPVSRRRGVIVLLVAGGYLLFSFSESMVAYSWVLVPTGLMAAGLTRRCPSIGASP